MDAHLSKWGTVFIEVSRFFILSVEVGICVSFGPVVSIVFIFSLFRQSPKSWVNHQKVKIVYVFNHQKSWLNHHGFNHSILHLPWQIGVGRLVSIKKLVIFRVQLLIYQRVKGTCSSSGLSLDSQLGILETSPEIWV